MNSITRGGCRSLHQYHALLRHYLYRNTQQLKGRHDVVDKIPRRRQLTTNTKGSISQLETPTQSRNFRTASVASLTSLAEIDRSATTVKEQRVGMSNQSHYQEQNHTDWMNNGIIGGLGLATAYAANVSRQRNQNDNSHTTSNEGAFSPSSSLHSILGIDPSASSKAKSIQEMLQPQPSTDCEPHRTPPGSAEVHVHGPMTSAENLDMLSSSKPKNVMLHRLRSVRGRGLTDKYMVDWTTVLGEGAYGSVHPARLRATGEKVALKKINRHYTNESTFQTETDALLRLYDNGGHPNISGLRDMYEDHNFYYLILDLVSGGEMFEHLINYGAYSEADAARLMFEVSSALAFLHGVGIIHMDLKPENLLLSTKNRLDGTIKMIDFGCAYITEDDQIDIFTSDPSDTMEKRSKFKTRNFSSTGTTAYWSPERFVPERKIALCEAPGMDMWSVGVILYIMLTGVHPFDPQGCFTDEEIEEQIIRDPNPPLSDDLVGHLSESAVDLIKKLMEPDPMKRITAYQMLHHPWVRGETASKEKIQDSDKKLSHFKDIRYKLEAGMFAVLVSQGYADARMSEGKVSRQTSKNKMLSADKEQEEDDKEQDENDEDEQRRESAAHIMQRAFAAFDVDGKGFVTSDDLGRVASELTGSVLTSLETKEYLQAATLPIATSEQGLDGQTNLSLAQFNKLFSGLNHKHFPRGHYIFHAGEVGDAMYFLSSGKVEIVTRKGQLVAMLRSGDFFGEGSLLDPSKVRFTSSRCATPVDVIEIKRVDFDRYIGASKSAKRDLHVKWRARSLAYAKNLLRLQTNLKIRNYKKGDVVYKEGDLGTSMFRVDDDNKIGGSLDVSHKGRVTHKHVPGDSFGESSLLFKRPRSSTVTCTSDSCRLHEMKGEDFLALVESSPEMAASLRNMARKRLFKKAVKAYSLEQNRGLSDEDLVAAFHDADADKSGSLNLDELRRLMHRMDPQYPMSEIVELLKYVDVDEDGCIKLDEFKSLFRQFDEVKEETAASTILPTKTKEKE